MLSIFVQCVYTVKSGSDPCSTLNTGGVGVRKWTLKADSKSGLQKWGPKQRVWPLDGEHVEEQVKVQGSISELINMLGGFEGLPA